MKFRLPGCHVVVRLLVIAAALSGESLARADDREEAKAHLQAARIAIAAADWKIAEKELLKAVALDPTNGVLHYNLAVVQQKLSPDAALASLQLALALGLPEQEKQAATDLKASLYYSREKQQAEKAPLVWLAGRWKSSCSVTTSRQNYRWESTLDLAPVGEGLQGRLFSTGEYSYFDAYATPSTGTYTNHRVFRVSVSLTSWGSLDVDTTKDSCEGNCRLDAINASPSRNASHYDIKRLGDDEMEAPLGGGARQGQNCNLFRRQR